MREINVLIVEDESIVAMEIESYIQKLEYGNIPAICSNADDAIKALSKYHINIALLDINLKGDKDGIEVASIIRQKYPRIEVIFLTAHLDDYNVDRAIELNPVAYLSKPFHREELRVVLKIAISKIEKNSRKSKITKKHLKLDDEFTYNISTHSLYLYDEMVHLTQQEYQLLELFMKNKNKLISFNTIEEAIWSKSSNNQNTMRSLVRRLRQKLKHRFIETLSSRGYMFVC
ncbi:MAG: response regulator [Sulfurovum sp.]